MSTKASNALFCKRIHWLKKPITAAFLLSLCLQPNFALAAPTSSDYDAVINAVSGAYSSASGIGTIVGFEAANSANPNGTQSVWGYNESKLGVSNVDANTKFRVGSQTKMMTSQVLLGMINSGATYGNNQALTLDTKISDLLEHNANFKNLMPTNSTEIANVTVRDLMNMGTNIEGHLLSTIPGGTYEGKTIGGAFTGQNFQSVSDANPEYDYSATNADGINKAFSNMIRDAINGEKIEFPQGTNGAYSNTNAIIMALIASGIENNQDFATLFNAYYDKNADTSNLTLEGSVHEYDYGTTGVNGFVNGVSIDGNSSFTSANGTSGIDPAIPGASGAAYTDAESLLNFIEDVYSQKDTILSDANTKQISLYGIPINYGLGIMHLDMSKLGMGNIGLYGHGGSVQGSDSFAGAIESNGTNLGYLSVMSNIYGKTQTEGGTYTSTAGYALHFELAQQLDRLNRAGGLTSDYSVPNSTGSNIAYNKDAEGKITSGTVTTTPMIIETPNGATENAKLILGEERTVEEANKSMQVRMNWNNFDLSFTQAIDPVFTYYNTNPATLAHDAIDILAGSGFTDYANNRAEAYAGEGTVTLLHLNGLSNVTINGQYAIYGSNGSSAIKLSNRSDHNIISESARIEAHGDEAIALNLSKSRNLTMNGTIQTIGTRNTGIAITDYGTDPHLVAVGGKVQIFGTNSIGVSVNNSNPIINSAITTSGSTNTGIYLGDSSLATSNPVIVVAENATIYSNNPVVAQESATTTFTANNSTITMPFTGSVALEDSFIQNVDTVTLNNTKLLWDNGSILPALNTNYPIAVGANENSSTISNTTISFTNANPLFVQTIIPYQYGLQAKVNINTSTGLNDAWYNSYSTAFTGKTMKVNNSDVAIATAFIADYQNLVPQASLDSIAASVGAHLSLQNTGVDVLTSFASHNTSSTLLAQNTQNEEAIPANSYYGANTALLEEANKPNMFFDVQAFYNEANYEKDASFDAYDITTKGFAAGFGYMPNDAFTFGPYFGFSTADADYDTLRSTMESDALILGLAGQYKRLVNEDWDMVITANTAYSSIDNESSRTALSSYGTTAVHKADFKQSIFTFGAEYAMNWNVMDNLVLTPALAFNYMYLDQDGYTESGLLAVQTKGFSDSIYFSTLKLDAEYTLMASASLNFMFGATAGWEHYLSDVQFNTNARYIGGSDFNVLSRPLDKDNILLGAHVGMAKSFANNDILELGLGYDARLAGKSQEHQGTFNIVYKF